MYKAHNFETMTQEKRPQDEGMDGSGLTFKTREHGGEYPDLMPQVILVTDANGRSCTYVPITENGKVVDSKGYVFDSRPEANISYAV